MFYVTDQYGELINEPEKQQKISDEIMNVLAED